VPKKETQTIFSFLAHWRHFFFDAHMHNILPQSHDLTYVLRKTPAVVFSNFVNISFILAFFSNYVLNRAN